MRWRLPKLNNSVTNGTELTFPTVPVSISVSDAGKGYLDA